MCCGEFAQVAKLGVAVRVYHEDSEDTLLGRAPGWRGSASNGIDLEFSLVFESVS